MMMSKPLATTRNQEATIYIGNLDEKATEPLLCEMMIQAGPVVHVHIPRDRVTQQHQGYGFCEFQGEEDAEYAVKVMNGVRFFGKPLRINKSSLDKRSLDIGANLFIGNLAPDVDEKLLFDTFILFGTLVQTPKIARDDTTGASKGYGFISYDSFEVSDAAIEAMNGQFLCNRPVTVNYAYKKDGKGERHGSAAERLLAAQTRRAQAPASVAAPIPPPMMGVPVQQAYPSNVPAAMYYSSGYPANPSVSMYPPLAGYPPQYAPPQYPPQPPPPHHQ